jgi:hypothetical protein
MTGRMSFLWLLGLSLLAGCGRSDRPTIRHVSLRPEDGLTATAGPTPPLTQVEEETCPGSASHSKVQGKRDYSNYKPDPQAFAVALAKMISTGSAKKAEGNLPKIGDTKPAAGRNAADVDSSEVRIGDTRLVSPKTWTRERPPIDLILAAFRLPRAEGDPADAQLTVTAAAQTDAQSLQRLREQLDQKPGAGSVEHLRIGASEVVLVESSGDSGDTSDPFPAPVSEGRYRALNATVFVGGRVYFITCTGPEKTVGERAGEFRGFLQTMKSVN